MASRPTLAKVALTAGVSKTTASYVLNGQKKMSAETTRRVKEAARRLGYRLDASASGLSRGRTQVVGVLTGKTVTELVTGSNSLFWLRLNDSFVQRCSEEGLVVAFAGEDRAQALIDSGVDTLIVLGSHGLEAFEGLRVPFGLPIISVDPIPDHDNVQLSYDNDAIAALVAGHFAEQGASHLAWVSAAGSEAVFAILVAALTNWATDNGMDFSCHVYDGLPDVQASIHEALDAGADGIFAMCGTPKRITEAIADRGLSIPDDILLVMQSEGAIEESMTPQLSNFSYLGTEAGITIAEMCVDVVKNGTHPTQLDLNFELVARESSLRTD
ncbi:MAG: LacI family DNA-binding transcriptional regulator [Candidatus Nanopelagicales bacterium]